MGIKNTVLIFEENFLPAEVINDINNTVLPQSPKPNRYLSQNSSRKELGEISSINQTVVLEPNSMIQPFSPLQNKENSESVGRKRSDFGKLNHFPSEAILTPEKPYKNEIDPLIENILRQKRQKKRVENLKYKHFYTPKRPRVSSTNHNQNQ